MSRLLTLIFAFFSGPAFAQAVAESIRKDEIVHMEDEAPAMRKAFSVARAGLDDFLKLAKNPPKQFAGFALKVAVTQGNDTEYFWVTDFAHKGGERFEGDINNEPRLVTTVKNGQRYAFTRARIVDWLYQDKAARKMVGNFTMCALLTQESKEEAAEVRRLYNLDCSAVGE
ncbi:MAG TPA: DUF2314 domain-containing protein [Steroidobacteraceae bacterium]|nr:DUF2314 domain-containing protein [Steroidobacteraceae bacterium]